MLGTNAHKNMPNKMLGSNAHKNMLCLNADSNDNNHF